jgi:hypothetical protein
MTLHRKDTVPMTVTLGILALLEAQPGKGSELAEFLTEARELAVAEEGTVTWYAFKISDTSYGIFDISRSTSQCRIEALREGPRRPGLSLSGLESKLTPSAAMTGLTSRGHLSCWRRC